MINIFDPAFAADPYAVLREARAEGPVVADAIEGHWVLDRAVMLDVLRSPRFVKDPRHAAEGIYRDSLLERGHFSLLYMDDPDHRRIRGMVARAFTHRAVEAMAPAIEKLANELLNEVNPMNGFDLIEAYAVPLPITVIATMLGVDPADRHDFARWSRDGAESLNPFLDEDTAARVARSREELFEYLMRTVIERRGDLRCDLISQLVCMQDEDGAHLSDEELVELVALLLGAGNVTTTDLIGNAMLALLQNRDQLALLEAQPELACAAVEETLRYDTPVIGTDRIALEDTEIAGCPIRKGEWVMPSASAANRDPHAHADPDRFDITRTDPEHFSFGGGPHLCLGAPLARLEATIALRTIVTRFPGLRLRDADVEPPRRSILGFRGVAELAVVGP